MCYNDYYIKNEITEINKINMEKEEIFRVIQEFTSNPPLILAGTGLTIPIGIPGMGALADYLQKQLDEKYNDHPAWINVTKKLNSGMDLETALSEDKLDSVLLDDVKKFTWELINKSDIDFLKEHHLKGHKGAFATLIGKFLRTTGHHLDIITTNYDRYIEYCCEQYDVEVDTGYKGIYKKSFDMSFSKGKIVLLCLKCMAHWILSRTIKLMRTILFRYKKLFQVIVPLK